MANPKQKITNIDFLFSFFLMLFPIQEQRTTRSVLGTAPREGMRLMQSEDGSCLKVISIFKISFPYQQAGVWILTKPEYISQVTLMVSYPHVSRREYAVVQQTA